MEDHSEHKSPEDPNLVYLSAETYEVVGAAMEVYCKLGPGFLEPVYQRALEIELEMRGIPFRPQERFTITYKGRVLDKEYVADFFCYDQIIVELKAVNQLSPIDWAQVINYLKVSGCRVGLLFNFCSHGKLEWKKLVI
ncbi:MAG: GxxExxY protein [Pyrinomonadaceae bacterium]